jgi:hypothetical protein
MVKRSVLFVIALLSLSAICHAQSPNLLKNPNADQQVAHWRVFGDATVEDSRFVVRNGGYFFQDVELPEDAAGQYAVFIGLGTSDRINSDGAITGLPYLYGYMMEDHTRILDYLQGQQMRADVSMIDEWATMWGIFQVPEKTKRVRFFLNQALANGASHNGSAARFDDVGLYLFATHKEAKHFVAQYPYVR